MEKNGVAQFSEDSSNREHETNSISEIGEFEVTSNNTSKEKVHEEETDILGNQRRSLTIVDDVVLIMFNSMLQTITQSWEGKLCMRPIQKLQSAIENTIEDADSSVQFDSVNVELTTNSSIDIIGNKISRVLLKPNPSREDSVQSSHNFKPKRKVKRRSVDQGIDHSETQIGGTEDVLSKNRRKEKKGFIKQIPAQNIIPAAVPDTNFTQEHQKKRTSKDKNGSDIEQNRSVQNGESKTEDNILPVMNFETELDKSATDMNIEKQKLDGVMREESTKEWRISFPDEDVLVIFTQGDSYEGRISRKIMEGHGCFSWTDGSKYEGEFVDGTMTGIGILEWKDQSWYEGEFYCGLRHGNGIYLAPESYVSYIGDWYLGEKHGEGIIYYGQKRDNYYVGAFHGGYYNGFGFRQYASGARYIGEWRYGLRHGNGIMIWPNNDIYHGEWEDGLMNGYGKYIWRAVVNNQLVHPSENLYQGSWMNGLRHGKGTLEKQCGNCILGEWLLGQKHGNGLIMCGDGKVITGFPLFQRDQLLDPSNDIEEIVSVVNVVKCQKSLPLIEQDKSNIKMKSKKFKDKSVSKNTTKLEQLTSITKDLSKAGPSGYGTHKNHKHYIGVTESRIFHESRGHPQKLSFHGVEYGLSYHLRRLQDSIHSSLEETGIKYKFDENGNKKDKLKNNKSSKIDERLRKCLNDNQVTSYGDTRNTKNSSAENFEKQVLIEEKLKMLQFEKKWLQNSIMLHLYDLSCIYKNYSIIACTEKPHFSVVLTRIMLWQLERDCGFHRNISLAEVDGMLVENPHSLVITKHNPFEKLQFWQFLQYLLELSWLLYGSKGIGYEGAPGILGSAFIRLVRNDILPNVGKNIGAVLFKYRNILPLEAVYMLYKEIGEPHSAREFLNKICVQKGEPVPLPSLEEYISPCWYPDHIRNGINTIYVGGNFIYLSGPEPISYSMTVPEDRNPPQDSHMPLNDSFATQLISLCKLGPTKVIEYLTTVCPSMKSGGLICNMDYQLTFLEFYEVLLMSAEGIIQKEKFKEVKLKVV